MNIYVTNLSTQTEDKDLAAFFQPYGEVSSAQVIIDKFTRKSRGFGFVDLPDELATAAIEALDGATLNGRVVRVMEARPKEVRPEGGESRRSQRLTW